MRSPASSDGKRHAGLLHRHDAGGGPRRFASRKPDEAFPGFAPCFSAFPLGGKTSERSSRHSGLHREGPAPAQRHERALRNARKRNAQESLRYRENAKTKTAFGKRRGDPSGYATFSERSVLMRFRRPASIGSKSGNRPYPRDRRPARLSKEIRGTFPALFRSAPMLSEPDAGPVRGSRRAVEGGKRPRLPPDAGKRSAESRTFPAFPHRNDALRNSGRRADRNYGSSVRSPFFSRSRRSCTLVVI